MPKKGSVTMSTKAMHTMVGIVLLAAAAAGVPSEARGQATEVRCPAGQGPQLDLGLGAISFARANIMPASGGVARMIWSFDGEPEINTLRPGGPAVGRLEPGDRVVSIDGLLITSAEGGRRWSGVGAGRTVALVVRRAGREREVRIEGAMVCRAMPDPSLLARMYDSARHSFSLTWAQPPLDPAGRGMLDRLRNRTPSRPASAAERRYQDSLGGGAFARARRGYYLSGLGGAPARFRVLFGFGLRCEDCYFETDSSNYAVAWRFSAPPVVTMVEDGGPAARAGLRVDDVIEAVDGVPIVGDDGGQRFSAAQPGRPVRFTVRRGGQALTLEIVPQSGAPAGRTPPPDRPE
jgi:membrane-associated protease RseP (regulator of RpoE activity)